VRLTTLIQTVVKYTGVISTGVKITPVNSTVVDFVQDGKIMESNVKDIDAT